MSHSTHKLTFKPKLVVALITGLLLSTVIQADPKPWFIDESKLPFAAFPGATALWGVHKGAGYQIEVPDDWNGGLVMYAHGFRGTGPELTVSQPPIRAHLIAGGFAWAASSYSANNYVPATGAIDTHALAQRFNDLVGSPTRTYITGHSMGGHVTGISTEQWPAKYDGALPMCGVMGDSELFDYFQDVYLAAETLIGNHPPELPTPDDYAAVGAAAAKAAMEAFPGGYPFALNPTGTTFKKVVENLTGGLRPTFNEGWFVWTGNFIFTIAGTGSGRENLETIYQFDDDPALSLEEQAFNDLIVRLAADPQFRRSDGMGSSPGSRGGINSAPIPGDIGIPVISLHTIGELFVPFHMEQIYARRVAAHGKSDLLVTRAIRDVFHCGFTLAEQEIAFDDLVNWVENGVKPDGDDILNPAAVADPAFGCDFTTSFSGSRGFLPPCPP